MKFYTNIILSFLCFTIIGEVAAQKTFQPKSYQTNWKGIIYRKEKAVELRLHTNGFLLSYNYGKITTYYKTNYKHISIGYLKDFREKRQNKNEVVEFSNRSKTFVFGKQNSIINLRAGLGVKRFLSEKADRKGIAIGYDYSYGPSIALVKPYYLELKYINNQGDLNVIIREEKYDKTNANKFTSHKDIFGGTSYFKGFSEMSLTPGIFGKLGLFFSMGAFDKYVKSIETGIMVDIYAKKIPIMVETELISNKPYHINFYLNFLFGKRSN
ncbi:MAG: hypothetical protein V3V14_09595 [Saprospiraceae bacterium]